MTDAIAAYDTEIEAIKQVVAAIESSQRRRDPDEFLALFHPDAIWTTGHGRVLIGRDAIAEFTRKVLPTAEDTGKVTYEVIHVHFIRKDVAAVKVRQHYPEPDGGGEGTPLYVMSKEDDGRWLLTACQNTAVLVN
jgi:conserved hypothetical protein